MINGPLPPRRVPAWLFAATVLLLLTLTGCERPDPEVTIVMPTAIPVVPPTPLITPHADDGSAPPTPVLNTPTALALPTYVGTPTPDPPHSLASAEEPQLVRHSVSAGETLGYIAQVYGTSIEDLLTANQMAETDLLFVGDVLVIPNQVAVTGPSFKIVPDSELIFGPGVQLFDVHAFVGSFDGYLGAYQEEVEGRMLSGSEIVALVAHRFSVNPRLLLAVLEYRSGWLTQRVVNDDGFPLGKPDSPGLYLQLGWAANQLNWGYYGRAEAGFHTLVLDDATRLAFAATINNGTAGVQTMLGAHDGSSYDEWLKDVGPDGLYATFLRLFGNPFAYTVDPLWPANLQQPLLQIPWSAGESWYFTGGPHGGWASGAAWAALDFAPPDDELGVCRSDHWVTAMADGIVTRSDFGAVVVDLDGDGFAGTGWAITYMHLETRDRVQAGTFVQTGDRLGHPSCEGGFASAKHVHLARTYNGRWVSADGPIPFEIGGWTSAGLGAEYDGQLIRGGVVKEACDGCREEKNTIAAD